MLKKRIRDLVGTRSKGRRETSESEVKLRERERGAERGMGGTLASGGAKFFHTSSPFASVGLRSGAREVGRKVGRVFLGRMRGRTTVGEGGC